MSEATVLHRPAVERDFGVGIDEIRFALDQRGLLPRGAWGKDSFDAHCPHHQDHTPSLSVKIGDRVSVVLCCGAGCSREEVLRTLGLWRELKGTREYLESIPREYVDVGGSCRDNLDVLVTRLRSLEIDAEPNEPFACVLPDHCHQAIVVAGDGHPARYRCGGDPAEDVRFSDKRLAEVFKWRKTGAPHVGMDGPLACRWFERFEFEAGLLKPTRIPVPIPIGVTRVTRRVLAFIALFLGLRDANARGYDWDRPFTFAKSFRADYCGVTEKQARDAMRALEQARSIRRVGKVPVGQHQAILWALGGAA